MSDFRLKIAIGDTQIELEGEGELVHTIFQEIKATGLEKFSSMIQATPKHIYSIDEKFQNDSSANADLNEGIQNDRSDSTTELPTLQNVVLQGNPKKESEWILVYALYASNHGKSLFSREDLRGKYSETNRVTTSNSSNFAHNLKSLVSLKYISAVNETDFRMETAGIEKARSIILGDSTDNGEKKKNSSARKRQPAQYKMLELGLTERERTSFREYWEKHNHSENMDKAVLAAYWLKANKEVSDFSVDHFFTMLRTIGESANFDLKSAITNAKNRKSYFAGASEKGAYVLYHLGEDHVRDLEIKEERDN